MLTPLSQPSLLTRIKSAADPWNQVADIHPSSCQTVAKRSQSPASRQIAQFSIRSRIAIRSACSASVMTVPPRVAETAGQAKRRLLGFYMKTGMCHETEP